MLTILVFIIAVILVGWVAFGIIGKIAGVTGGIVGKFISNKFIKDNETAVLVAEEDEHYANIRSSYKDKNICWHCLCKIREFATKCDKCGGLQKTENQRKELELRYSGAQKTGEQLLKENRFKNNLYIGLIIFATLFISIWITL